MKRFLTFALVLVAVVLSGTPAAGVVSGRGKPDEPRIEFQHRYSSMHLDMKLSKLKTMNWMLPKDLRREIGDDYYPQIRRQLATKDKMQYKEGEAEVQRFPDGKVKLTLTFPNFIMIISNVTWEQLDVVFAEYF